MKVIIKEVFPVEWNSHSATTLALLTILSCPERFQYIINHIGRPSARQPPDRFSNCFGRPLLKENHTSKIKGVRR